VRKFDRRYFRTRHGSEFLAARAFCHFLLDTKFWREQSQITNMSSNLILEDGFSQRKHRPRLTDLLASTKGILRIASAYVTDRNLLIGAKDLQRRLLISLLPMDVASGATKIETLGALIKSGVNCRILSERPRLHAKVYIFGSSCAVITSANLTNSAFDSNIEVGVEVNVDQTNQLVFWFDSLWEKAVPLTLDYLSKLQKDILPLRKEFEKLKIRTRVKLQNAGGSEPIHKLTDTLLDLFGKANQYFVCNTDRRQGKRTVTNGYVLEEEMHNQGFAAAWESFKYPDHMTQVKSGDAIFMFAKGIGIIAVGVAKGRYEKLAINDPGRIRNFSDENNTTEWRVPVQWLDWKDESGAFQWKAPNRTFWNVTGNKDFRDKVKNHFLCDV
jgi:hypothetical protein